MSNVAVLRAHVLPSADPKRPGQMDTLVAYQVDGDPLKTRLLAIPGSPLSEAQVMDAIRKDVAQATKLESLKFTL
jgi:hypothetical protein